MIGVSEATDQESAAVEVCRVCLNPAVFIFSRPLLGNPTSYFDCPTCGYVQTQTPYWLEQAYAQPIGDADTGIMLRNRANVAHLLLTLAAIGRLRGRVLDVGAGYGILVRMLRDSGVDAYWDDKHCKNLFARGFERRHASYDLVTAFEVFEHLEHPTEHLRELLATSGAVLISTVLAPPPGKLGPDWWYLVPEFGQHIGFLRQSTLTWIAKRLGCSYATDFSSIHLFARDPAITKRWALLRRFTPLASRLARYRLTSRTVEDFESIRANVRAAQLRPRDQGTRDQK